MFGAVTSTVQILIDIVISNGHNEHLDDVV